MPNGHVLNVLKDEKIGVYAFWMPLTVNYRQYL